MTSQPTPATFVYTGSYTRSMPHVQGKAAGLSVYRMDPATGALTLAHTVIGLDNPSYLALDPHGRYLYAAEEITVGHVSAFAVDPATGGLTLLNRQPSQGADPAHLCVDRDGHWLLVANYSSGTIAIFPVAADGSLGAAADVVQHHGSSVHPERQQAPHAHYITVDPSNRFVLVADLGMDAVLIYRLDSAQGRLVSHDPPAIAMPPGSGPRHLAWHPDGRHAYVIHELASTLEVCSYDAQRGRLQSIQQLSTLPDGFTGTNSTAAVRVAPSGRFVYGSNRGHDSIASFAVDGASGKLRATGHTPTQGRTPRDFNIDPAGRFLLAANQDTDTIVVFSLDEATGALMPTGQVVEIKTPVCIAFRPPVR